MDTPHTTKNLGHYPKPCYYTAKSAAAEELPPNFSPSSNFCKLFNPQAMPLEPCALYG